LFINGAVCISVLTGGGSFLLFDAPSFLFIRQLQFGPVTVSEFIALLGRGQ